MNSGWKVKELEINSKVRLHFHINSIDGDETSSHHSIEYGGTGKSQKEKVGETKSMQKQK